MTVEIEFHERKDGSKIAGVKIGNTVYAKTCQEWRGDAVEIIARVSAYLEKEEPQSDSITIACEYCRHPYPVREILVTNPPRRPHIGTKGAMT